MTTQPHPRRSFDTAFKLKVVHTIQNDGLSVSQVCQDLDLTESAVRRWVVKYDAERRDEPIGGVPLTAEQRCIRELERENR